MGAALARDRHVVDDIHATLSRSPIPRQNSANPKPESQSPQRTRVVPSQPVPVRTATQWPPDDAFVLRLRLEQLSFPGGFAALPALYIRAPGGAFGKVLIGSMARTGTPAAVKVLLDTDRDAFLRESENLLRLRAAADAVRVKEEHGVPLELADMGAGHVAYVYGTGEEQDLAVVNSALPHGPAFLIAVEPLAETLTERMRRVPRGLLPLSEALRAGHEIALGLAFLAKHGVVVSEIMGVRWLGEATGSMVLKEPLRCHLVPAAQHSDLKPDNVMFRRGTGDLVLCDLGVGRLTGGGCATTAYDGHGGTLLYLAPELHSNEDRSATFASDM